MAKAKKKVVVDEEEDVVVPVVDGEGIKSLEEKTDEIKAQAEDLGMHDPSTEAKIKAMETAIPRSDRAELIQDSFDARDEARDTKGEELVAASDDKRAANEALSAKMQVEKTKDEKQSESERAKEFGAVKATNLN